MDKQLYQRDGYVIVRNLIPDAMLSEIGEEIVDTFQHRARAMGLVLPSGRDQDSLSSLLAGVFERDQRSYIAAAKLAQALLSVQRLGVAKEMTSVLEGLDIRLAAYSTKPVIHFMADRLKVTGGYHKTPTHQDWRSAQGSLDAVTVWLPMFDVGPTDYPLEIIPRSHLDGLLPSVEDRPNWRVRDELWNEADFETLSLKRGDAIFFSAFLVHRTGQLGGERVRVALSYRYNNVAEPHFAARNYPDTYLYRPDPALVDTDFPTRPDLVGVFPLALDAVMED